MDEKSTNYGQWTKDALIARIRALENEARTGQSVATQPIEPAAASSLPKEGEAGGGDDGSTEPQKKKKKKGDRKIDPSRYTTRLVALKLAYLGKNYGGFEFQASSTTIEEELWKALVKSCLIFPENPDVVDWGPWEYSKCGRTDRGVSAFGQVIAIRLRSNRPVPKQPVETPPDAQHDGIEKLGGADEDMPDVTPTEEKPQREFDDFADEIAYPRLLNRLLPPEIRVLAWCPTTPADFSARHHCRERQYRYFFTQPAYSPMPLSFQNPNPGPTDDLSGGGKKRKGKGAKNGDNRPNSKGNPENGGNSTRKPPRDGWLDLDAMRVAAKKFEGEHDFRNFCKIDGGKNMQSYVRRIFESDIVEVKGAETEMPHLLGPEYNPIPSSSSSSSSSATSSPQERFPKVYYFHVRGSAFLWHQIRCMVSILFLVAQGLEDPSIIDRLLDITAEPRRPNYLLADEVPLVLWDCKFPKNLDDPLRPDDALSWVRVGEDSPAYMHSAVGLANGLWETWRERKMDEILASQLLGLVSGSDEITTGAKHDISRRLDPRAPAYAPDGRKAFYGGNSDAPVGRRYVPLLERSRLASPAEAYDREAQRKGFRDLAHMREVQAQQKAEVEAAATTAGSAIATGGEDDE